MIGHGEDQSGARQDRTTRRQAGQDHRARAGPNNARQDRTTGRGGRIRGDPKEQAAAVAVFVACTPDGARGTEQASSAVAISEPDPEQAGWKGCHLESR